MIDVKVGGVPEHFNLAWHIANDNKWFLRNGIRLHWQDIPGGTGAMCKALRNNELDIAIALTEGVVADILNGNPSRIVQFYVNSPLRWGIFVSAKSDIHEVHQMAGKKYAISRFTSGSHLMAYVNASQHQFKIDENDFVVVGNLDGARKALAGDSAQLFLWEKFTTKPLVDSGEFRMIGECKTPWPCFVIAATNHFIETYPLQLQTLLNTINLSCMLLKNNSHAPEVISAKYGISIDDARLWFKELEYAYEPTIDEYRMLDVFQNLKKYHIIQQIPAIGEVCYEPNIFHME